MNVLTKPWLKVGSILNLRSFRLIVPRLGKFELGSSSIILGSQGKGAALCHGAMVGILVSWPSCPGFNSQRSQKIFQRKESLIEESGQWLENVDQTHLVLASGKKLGFVPHLNSIQCDSMRCAASFDSDFVSKNCHCCCVSCFFLIRDSVRAFKVSVPLVLIDLQGWNNYCGNLCLDVILRPLILIMLSIHIVLNVNGKKFARWWLSL